MYKQILTFIALWMLPASMLEAHERPFPDDVHPHPPFNAAGAVQLSKGELKGLTNTTWYMVKRNWISYIDPTGKIVKTKNIHTSYKEAGVVHFNDIADTGRICLSWKTFKQGRTTCFYVWKKGDVYIFVHGMWQHGRMTVKRGNVENL